MSPDELPLIVQLLRVAVPAVQVPPPSTAALLPLIVQLVEHDRAFTEQAAAVMGGIAADRAFGEGGRAAVI